MQPVLTDGALLNHRALSSQPLPTILHWGPQPAHRPAAVRGARARRLSVSSAVVAPPDHRHMHTADGHSALLQGLGELGDVTPGLMPGLLRLSHIRYRKLTSLVQRPQGPFDTQSVSEPVWLFRAKVQGGDSNEALKENARGILIWQVSHGCFTLDALQLTHRGNLCPFSS